MNNTVNIKRLKLLDAYDRLIAICEINNISREIFNKKILTILEENINEDVIVCLNRWILIVIKNYEDNLIDNFWKLEFDEQQNTITKIERK